MGPSLPGVTPTRGSSAGLSLRAQAPGEPPAASLLQIPGWWVLQILKDGYH